MVRLVVSAGGWAGTVWGDVSGFIDEVSVLNLLVSDFTIAVSVLTAAVSPRSGAAPVSSARLWQAAKVAAAARIQRVFMISPSGDRGPARRGVVADIRQPRACDAKLEAEAPKYPGSPPLTRSWITIPRGRESGPEGLQIPVQLQGGRIGQRIHILYGAAVNHVPNGQLGNLPADGAGNVRYLQNLARYMMWARVLANPPPDAVLQRL